MNCYYYNRNSLFITIIIIRVGVREPSLPAPPHQKEERKKKKGKREIYMYIDCQDFHGQWRGGHKGNLPSLRIDFN